MFVFNTTSIAEKISPFVLRVVVCHREINCFCLLTLIFLSRVTPLWILVMHVLCNRKLMFGNMVDLYCGNKACMNSLLINNLSSVCLCLAPKFDKIKDHKGTAFVRISRLLKLAVPPRKGLADPASHNFWEFQSFIVHLVPSSVGQARFVASCEVLPLAQTRRPVGGGWAGSVLQKENSENKQWKQTVKTVKMQFYLR